MDTKDSQRALRARLLELLGAVQAYFETTVAVGSTGGHLAAFEALRRSRVLALFAPKADRYGHGSHVAAVAAGRGADHAAEGARLHGRAEARGRADPARRAAAALSGVGHGHRPVPAAGDVVDSAAGLDVSDRAHAVGALSSGVGHG